MRSTGRPRTFRRGLGILILILAIGAILYSVPTPYMIVTPGVTRDLKEVVTVEGGHKTARGRFLMVTVSSRPANALLYLYAKLDREATLEPRPKDPKEMQEEGKRMMTQSQAIASAVAERSLGLPARVVGTGVKVTEILPGSPAAGKLQTGDVIIALNGRRVQFRDEFRDQLSQEPIGAKVKLKVRRGAQEVALDLNTVEHPTRKDKSALKIGVEDDNVSAWSPVPVKIDAGNIIGPSAGLMFTLEIMNQLTGEGDLTGGRAVAGTGTILPTGKVGPIGGVTQKVITAENAGAVAFLTPTDDVEEARAAAKKIEIVPVKGLDDALEYLRRTRPAALADSALTGRAGNFSVDYREIIVW